MVSVIPAPEGGIVVGTHPSSITVSSSSSYCCSDASHDDEEGIEDVGCVEEGDEELEESEDDIVEDIGVPSNFEP